MAHPKSNNPSFDPEHHHPNHQRVRSIEHLSREVPDGYPSYLSDYEKANRHRKRYLGQRRDYYKKKINNITFLCYCIKSPSLKLKEVEKKAYPQQPVQQDRSVFSWKSEEVYIKKQRRKKQRTRKCSNSEEYMDYALGRLQRAAAFGVVVDVNEGMIYHDLEEEPVLCICLLSVFLFLHLYSNYTQNI